MGLQFIEKITISSAVGEVVFDNKITTDDMYLLTVTNLQSVNDNVEVRMRVGTSGTLDSDSEYDAGGKVMKSYAGFDNLAMANADNFYLTTIGTPTQEQYNGLHYLTDFASSSKYSYLTYAITSFNSVSKLSGTQGGGFHTVAETNNSVGFVLSSGNMDAGEFILYKIS